MNLPNFAAKLRALSSGAQYPPIGDSELDRLATWAEKKLAPRFGRAVVKGQGSTGNFLAIQRNGEGAVDGHDIVTIAPIAHPQVIGIPTAAAGGGAGASCPAPVIVPGSLDTKGSVTFGSGTSGVTGLVMVTVTFSTPFLALPKVMLVWENGNAPPANLLLYPSAVTLAGFSINAPGLATLVSHINTYWQVGWTASADPGGVVAGDPLHTMELSPGQQIALGKSRF